MAALSALAAAAILGGVGVGSARADGNDLAVAYQVDVGHSGLQSDSSLVPPFALRWRMTLPGPISYPLIAQGMVYVTAGDRSTTLYALDQATGSVVWSRLLPFYYAGAAPAYDAGRIFVADGDVPVCCQRELIQAYAADTGALLWTTSRSNVWGPSPPPTAANGVVYVSGSGYGGSVFALDEATGSQLGSAGVLGGDSSPALSGASVFVSYACNQVYGFSQSMLSPLWHYSTGCYGGGGKTAVYANGRVYSRYYDGNLILDAASGTLLRTFTGANVTSLAPAVDGSRIFTLSFPTFSTDARTLTAQTADEGSTLWTFAGDGQLDTAPIVLSTPSGEFVVEGSASGMLYALDATSGAVIWTTNVGAAIREPDERSWPWPGLAAGQGLLVVPAGNTISAYVPDTTAPTITVPATLNTTATSPAGATVSYTVTATDPDDPANVTCTPASGSTFPIGATTVQCTATDTAGNEAHASFNVVVAPDTTAPTITVPATINAPSTSSAGASIDYTVSASDPDDTATLSCAPVSGSTFAVGPTTVHCAATDGSGNSATASFLVVVSAQGADCNLAHYASVKGALALKNANLSGCDLAGANLSGANATNANLADAYLDGADLSAATLSQTNLERAVLTHASLSNAKISSADLSGASLASATLSGVSWIKTTCPDGTNSNNDGGSCAGHLG